MFLHIRDTKHAGQYKLRVTFNDGAVKIVDLYHELEGPIFEPLKDIALFRQAAVNPDTGTVEWPNGADFAPEFLYEIGTPAEADALRRVAEGRPIYGRQKRRSGGAGPDITA